MDYKELFQSAIQALRINVMRTLLTMLGIIIGISSVILIFSIGQGAIAYVNSELSSFGTNFFQINPGSSMMGSVAGGKKSITLDDVEAIKKDTSLTNIETVSAFTMVSAVVSANDIDKSLMVYGAMPQMQDILKLNVSHGIFLTDEHDLEMQKVAVIEAKTAETFFGKDANPVGEKIKIDKKTFKIIGVAGSGSPLFGGFFNNTLFIPLSVSQHEIEGHADIAEVDITVHNTDIMNDTMESVAALLRDRHNLKEGAENDFIMSSATDALSTVQTITNLLTLIVGAISAISLVVGGVGVMNIMLVSVTERTKEIGLLKAIGAQEKDILTQFLIESMVMTGIGGILGIIIGIFLAFLVTLVAPIPLVIVPSAVLIAVLVSAGVGIVFGLYPARRAAKLSPIDALRYE
jgi:putative ABC transport system permease protein